VTVGSAGQMERLDLDDRVRELPGPRLAQEIMAVMRRAQTALSGKVAEQVRETVGEDTETGRAVLHSFEGFDSGYRHPRWSWVRLPRWSRSGSTRSRASYGRC
jgi:hypothetical protein